MHRMLFAVPLVVVALGFLAPAADAQITPQPIFSDNTVGVQDGDDGAYVGNPTSTITTSFTSGVGVDSVSVTYTNQTTGATAEGSHEFNGAKSGTYSDQMENTKRGDKVRVVKVYELSNGQTVTRISNITIQ